VMEEKQKAVSELSKKIGFRQSIQAHGKGIDDSLEKLESVKDFFKEPDTVSGRGFLLGFIHFFPLVTLTFVVLIFFGWSWLWAVGCVLVEGIVNRIYHKSVSRIYILTAKSYTNLSLYSKVIAEIENEHFESSHLEKLRNCFFMNSKSASIYIKKLATRFQYFEARSSAMIHFFMNNIFFWDLHCLYRIEKWKRDLGSVIDAWFEAIGFFDALSSLGNLRFNFPDWTTPDIKEGTFKLSALSLGHPLIPEAERIVNSIELAGGTNITIVTGPNMAGKTTFLKTIGVNVVLALAGAPVCARRFEICPLRLYTSMKVSDSLDKGLSLFYAELQRLKKVLDAILRNEPVFFLIDEMLKGTNELDRHKGAVALISQLIEQRARGMLATHDMELTKLEQDFPDAVHNYHFDGYIEGDKLLFDYKLKEGVCTSSNALELMKKIGIKVR
jgi:DNA mismatch repair ATPase MutS